MDRNHKRIGKVNEVLEELMKHYGDAETSTVVLCEVVRKMNLSTNKKIFTTVLDDDLRDEIMEFEKKLINAGDRKLDIVLRCIDEMLERSCQLWLPQESFARKLVQQRREGIKVFFCAA